MTAHLHGTGRNTPEELANAYDTLHKLYLDLEAKLAYDHPILRAIDTTGAFIKATLTHERESHT